MAVEILFIHQDRTLRESARQVLEQAGHVVIECSELTAAWSCIGTMSPALVLLPWTDEQAVKQALRLLRAQDATRGSRIIMVVPRTEVREAIAALEFGVEDCVAVPFVAEELVGRVNACLRRPLTAPRSDQIQVGPILLDRDSHRLFISEELIQLAPTEFRLLACFLEHQGRMLTRGELLERAWPNNIKAGARTVDVHVQRLRQVLELHGCDHMIQTVRGFGYRFHHETPKVTAGPAVSAAAMPRL